MSRRSVNRYDRLAGVSERYLRYSAELQKRVTDDAQTVANRLAKQIIDATIQGTGTSTTRANTGSTVTYESIVKAVETFKVEDIVGRDAHRSPFSLLGQPVYIVPDYPRYTLPAEVIPGVSWPAGFKEEIDAWSRKFLGRSSLLKDGEMIWSGGAMYMTEATYRAMQDTFAKFDKEVFYK